MKNLVLKSLVLIIGVIFAIVSANAQVVTYAGNSGNERFNCVVKLSDGTFLVGGSATDLNWIPSSTNIITLTPDSIKSNDAVNRAFLLHLSPNLQNIINALVFPAGTVTDVCRIRNTSAPGQPTGELFISGRRSFSPSSQDGYYIIKLSNNFVNGLPTSVTWGYNVLCPPRGTAESAFKTLQPWDVGFDGKVVYGRGTDYDMGWAAIERLDYFGRPETVEWFPAHFGDGIEYDSMPLSSHSNPFNFKNSAIVLKAGRKGSLRSMNWADYNLLQNDENGNPGRKGKNPDDYYYQGPCIPSTTTCLGGPGYTGYRVSSRPTQRLGGIVVDRYTNDFYYGYSTQTILPDGLPDFEPVIVAIASDGKLKWWRRLYKEDNTNSTPDQYIDGIEFDYTFNLVTVLARCHGNAVVNLWAGNNLFHNPSANGFQNRFTGNNGNIHIGWLGKFTPDSGKIMHATFVAEYAEGATLGTPSTDPIMDNWANPNTGWPNVNTTRCNSLIVGEQGEVCVTAVGRRTITTANAFQKMIKPSEGSSSWNSFVRVYAPDLSLPWYSSILTGRWDASTGSGGDNTTLYNAFPMNGSVVAVGQHNLTTTAPIMHKGNAIPTASVPAWGDSLPNMQSAIFAWMPYVANSTIGSTAKNLDSKRLKVYYQLNKAVLITVVSTEAKPYAVLDISGKVIARGKSSEGQIQLTFSKPGMYVLQVSGYSAEKIIIQ